MASRRRDTTPTVWRIGIAAARFNSFISDRLLEGAVAALRRAGVSEPSVTVLRTPGAFELPIALKRMAVTGKYDGLVAIGCVIRGATPHFDYVAGECARGVQSVSLECSVPIGFGVLTVDTLEQAIDRAGAKYGNKGEEAARAVLEMLEALRDVGPAGGRA